jgi:hypothetical protein
MHGWYSEQQKKHNIERTKLIYYTNKNDEIIEVTEVSQTEKYPSNFTDAVYLGPLKAFYKVTNTEILKREYCAP